MPDAPRSLATRHLLAYAALGVPLAMAALPIYVLVPSFYTGTLGLELGLVGFILMAARSLDALQDPLLGHLSDRTRQRGGSRLGWVAAGLPLLGFGMWGLLAPPSLPPTTLVLWLTTALVVTYLGFSMTSVSYQALGAELSDDRLERTRVTTWREGLALVGVFIAAALPEWWANSLGPQAAYARFALLFGGLLLLLGAVTLWWTPAPPGAPPNTGRTHWRAMLAPCANHGFRRLALVFALSGIAASIPATVVLFFVKDVIGRADLGGAFLVVYFAAGAAGMPLWLVAARRYGKAGAWLLGMALSITAFVWAFWLRPGDVGPFFVICALSGLALGADLALPPALLADVIDADEVAGLPRREGAYFGLWHLLSKANLALAAGVSLPLLQALGYQPGAASADRHGIILQRSGGTTTSQQHGTPYQGFAPKKHAIPQGNWPPEPVCSGAVGVLCQVPWAESRAFSRFTHPIEGFPQSFRQRNCGPVTQQPSDLVQVGARMADIAGPRRAKNWPNFFAQNLPQGLDQIEQGCRLSSPHLGYLSYHGRAVPGSKQGCHHIADMDKIACL